MNSLVLKWYKDTNIKWTLYKDNNSSYSSSQNGNIIQEWKESYRMSRNQGNYRYYFNCPRAPELNIIKYVWQLLKEYLKTRPYWDNEIVWELAREKWEQTS